RSILRHRRLAVAVEPPFLRSATTDAREASQAGIAPKIKPVTAAAITAAPSTRPSSAIALTRGTPLGRRLFTHPRPHAEMSKAPMVAEIDRIRLSVRSRAASDLRD